MNKEKYDNEATQFQSSQSENTEYLSTPSQSTTASSSATTSNVANKKTQAKKGKTSLKRAAVGFGAGLAFGGAYAAVSGMNADDAGVSAEDDDNSNQSADHELIDGQIAVADNVSDDMSFGEAFAAARAEVGPGGVFEWHGQIYGTYTAEEWNAMTPEEQAEFQSHFGWEEHTASADAVQPETVQADEIEVVTVEHVEHPEAHEMAMHEMDANAHVDMDVAEGHVDMVSADANPEIEVLGVYHNEETGQNVGHIVIDGKDALVIDVDGDMEFDVLAVDHNGNCVVDHDEVFDIHGQGLGVNDLLAHQSNDDMMADGTFPHDSTDGLYEI
jgi:hypothetical protein